MISALFDTNVLYSALVRPGGASGGLLRLAATGSFELWVSSGILAELAAILSRPKAHKELGRGYGKYGKKEVASMLESLAGSFYDIGQCPATDVVQGDPNDNHVVSAAVYAQVDYLVTGDRKHVLPLNTHPGLRTLGLSVVTVGEFMEIIAMEIITDPLRR